METVLRITIPAWPVFDSDDEDAQPVNPGESVAIGLVERGGQACLEFVVTTPAGSQRVSVELAEAKQAFRLVEHLKL